MSWLLFFFFSKWEKETTKADPFNLDSNKESHCSVQCLHNTCNGLYT